VIVTGAGQGLGRAHALEYARQGANVVVNDIESSRAAAQAVVDEILAAGGRAVVSTGDVSDWAYGERLVRQAVETFGGLHTLVNNAGINRDRMLVNMSEQEWDLVLQVDLKGHFVPMRHAAAYWRDEAKAGRRVAARVVNTSSGAGLMGSVGQGNYGAAKAGIAALTLVASQELERYGVRVNAIAPVARTRLTLATPGMGAMFAEEVPEGEFDAFSPANIAPVVGYLAQEKCPLNGQVLAVQGGAIQRLAGWTVEETIETDGPWLVEDLEQRLADWV